MECKTNSLHLPVDTSFETIIYYNCVRSSLIISQHFGNYLQSTDKGIRPHQIHYNLLAIFYVLQVHFYTLKCSKSLNSKFGIDSIEKCESLTFSMFGNNFPYYRDNEFIKSDTSIICKIVPVTLILTI